MTKLTDVFYALVGLSIVSFIFGVKEGLALIPGIAFVLYVMYKRNKYEKYEF